MTSKMQIACLIRDHQQAKNKVRELRTEMMRIAVEELNLDQKTARDIPIEVFLDGYLVGQGVMQSWRRSEESEIA